MAIPQRRYVDIVSAVIGEGGAGMQKLDGRIFTNNEAIGTDQILEFTTAPDVAHFFGLATPEADFAAAYFALTTPAPVSRASALQFAYHSTEHRAYTFTGGVHQTFDQLELINDGKLTITVGGVDFEVTGIDLTDVSIESMFDIAGLLTTKFAATNVNFDYDGTYLIAYGAVGTELSFSEDLAAPLGLDNPTNIDEGKESETMAQAWLRAQQKNDSYGTVHFLTQSDNLPEIVEVAELVSAENVKHQLIINVEYADRQTYFDALGQTASVGLILKDDNTDRLAHLPMALLSATNYNRANATMNYMYRQAGVTIPPQVNDNLMANELDALRINYYGQTAVAGSDIRFFQRAFLCGSASAPVDMSVHGNEQWLKARITQLWFDLLLGTRGIPANLDGKARGALIIASVIDEAIRNGVILRGSDITPVEKIAIMDAAGGDENAWITVMNDGAWFSVDIHKRTGESNVTEEVLDYVLVYKKGDWVRKITGSHNLV